MFKRGITWCLVLVMAISLGACSKKAATEQQSSSSPSTSQSSTLLYDKLTTWKVMVPKFVNAPLKGDQLTFTEMQKRTNVKLDIDDSTTAGDYMTKVNMLLASGDIPQMMVAANLVDFSKFIPQGLFQDLTPSLQKYGQDFMKEIALNPSAKKNVVTEDGKYYFFPSLSIHVDAALYMINKPWLDKLKLPVPKTIDELYTTLKAFKTLGPDIVPWTKGQFFGNLEYGAFIPFGTWDNFKLFPDGKYEYGPYQRSSQMKDALKWLNKLYTEGLIDKEYLTLDNDSYTAKFKKGVVGFVYGYPGAPLWNVDAAGKTIEPKNSDWQLFTAIQGPTGIKNAAAINPIGAPLFVTKTLKDLDKAVQYMNYIYSDGGKMLFNFGNEGETYTKTNGKLALTDKILKHEAGPVNGARNFGMNPNNFPFDRMDEMTALLSPRQTYDAMMEAIPFNEPSAPTLIGSADEEKQFADIMVNCNKYVQEMIPKFITGQVSIDTEFNNFLDQLKKFKIEDAIKIKKAQFDKWNARK